ncbi:NAD(P)-dependent alcohol dehydrogenase [Algoriphagus confluentis]
MKAAVCSHYGPPEVVKIQQTDMPLPGEDEILVMVIAADLNAADKRVRRLEISGFLRPLMRMVLGFNKPRRPILGTAFSGIVIRKGKKVNFFHPGDEVFGVTGLKFGAHAEYLVIKESGCVVTKPKHCSFEEAAALPFGGQTASYFLGKLGIKKRVNPKVLIIGSTGAVGTAAVQICKSYEINPTVVCSSQGLDLMKKMGVEQIICYDQTDYTKISEKFDLIFDAFGNSNKKACLKLLNTGGAYRSVGGLEISSDSKEQLYYLKTLVDQGKFKPVIDRFFSLDEIVEAHHYLDSGRKKGTIIIRIKP